MTVSDVIAEAIGGDNANGVNTSDHGAILENVIALARGATNNVGLLFTCTPGFPYDSGYDCSELGAQRHQVRYIRRRLRCSLHADHPDRYDRVNRQ